MALQQAVQQQLNQDLEIVQKAFKLKKQRKKSKDKTLKLKKKQNLSRTCYIRSSGDTDMHDELLQNRKRAVSLIAKSKFATKVQEQAQKSISAAEASKGLDHFAQFSNILSTRKVSQQGAQDAFKH